MTASLFNWGCKNDIVWLCEGDLYGNTAVFMGSVIPAGFQLHFSVSCFPSRWNDEAQNDDFLWFQTMRVSYYKKRLRKEMTLFGILTYTQYHFDSFQAFTIQCAEVTHLLIKLPFNSQTSSSVQSISNVSPSLHFRTLTFLWSVMKRLSVTTDEWRQ